MITVKPTSTTVLLRPADSDGAESGFEIEVEIPPSGPVSLLIVEPSGEETEVAAGGRDSRAWSLLRERILPG